MEERPWQQEVNEIEASYGTSAAEGLSEQEAESRMSKYGPNSLKEKKAISPWKIFFSQFQDLMIWILIGAAAVSAGMALLGGGHSSEEWIDAGAIIAIVVLNAFLGFIQEYRAEKSLEALKKLASPSARVVRGGNHCSVRSSEIVPGDLVELEAGDNVPADGRLVWVTPNFSTQEASLTGESTPVVKTVFALEEADVALADRANMVYLGTSVAAGKARAVISETGMATELGRIAGMIQEIRREVTPLQRKLEEFGTWIVKISFALVGVVFLLGFVRGVELMELFMTSVSLAVAAIPEGLPAVVTIALALGVQRMVKRHALIRKLPSVETLGAATVICSDKTGTLTENKMTVKVIYAGGQRYEVTGKGYEPQGEFSLSGRAVNPKEQEALMRTLLCSVLCNGAQLTQTPGGWTVSGDPTEGALLTAAAKADIWKKDSEWAYEFIEEVPFDSVRKKMTIVRRSPEKKIIAFVKGAPDVLVDDCWFIEENGIARGLTAQDKERILLENSELSNRAMRVLAVACRTMDRVPETYESKYIERDLTFLGLLAMIDPPRKEVADAINVCKGAGIRTVMITGDHKNTAVAIARELGFFKADSIALSGEELDALSDESLASEIERIPVYARVSPEHKLRIVQSWRKRGEIVAMTGDGVNDAPAVREADIGVAMGITGTDVTKEVSDMVVTDDNFASIVAAVEEGRGIYANIKKFIHYLLSCNAGEILVMFTASILNWPVPLYPIHLLWINIVTDGLPALALGMDPVRPGVMKKPPRSPSEPVITRDRAFLIVSQGALIAFCSLVAFGYILYIENEGLGRAMTGAFIVLSCSQLFHSFNCRSQSESLFSLGIFTNTKLVLANLVSFALQIAVVYVPCLRVIFKTEPLSAFDWFLVIGLSSLPLWAMELVKFLRLSGRKEKHAIA